tara:strand:- start:1420 stop:1947 length:528 start_codon:yes stop_codon:yes gene_type:complete
MNYVKIYNLPQSSQSKAVIGIVNAKLLENISWYLRTATTEAGGNEYQIHGMYYGSTADVDFSLNIPALTSPSPEDPSAPSSIFDTDAKKAKIMNIMVDGISKACQATYVTPGSTVLNWYPPFAIGNDFVIESNPFQPAAEVNPPGEEFTEPGGELEKGGGHFEGPFEGPGGPEFS